MGAESNPPANRSGTGEAAGTGSAAGAGAKRRTRDADEGSSPQQQQPKPSRRRISHISKACNGCRRRKMKCDGAQPSCSICKVYKEECVYNAEQDGRRSAPKAYVASLEEKIRVLEGVLNAHGIDEKTPLPDSAETKPSDVVAAPVVDSGERLKIDENTGELLECGPTSLFSHKPEGDGKSPADSLSPGSLSADRPAVLHPRPSLCPELGSPELDGVLHDEVLRLFFEYFNTQCFWVNEKGFKRDLESATAIEGTIIHARRTAYYSPMLHNVVLSVGVLMLPIEKTLRDQLAYAFSKRAKDLIEEESEAPMMSTVSALMLLGTYHAATARQNLGFLYSGMGLRLVQALGLGTNCSYWVKNGSITEEQQMGRYHLFYAAYVLDKCWSTYVGRGASMSLSNYDIPVPDPDPEEDEVLWQPMIEAPPQAQGPFGGGDDAGSGMHLGEPVKGWRSTTWAWTCRLAIIAERVLGTVYSIGFNTNSANVQHIVSNLDVKLEKWLDEIPDALRLPQSGRGGGGGGGSGVGVAETRIVPSHILGLHAFHCFILILLHRPWFAQLRPVGAGAAGSAQADTTAEISVAKCERAATKVVQLVHLYERCPGLRHSPITLNQIVFSAGTVHMLCATHNTGRKARASVDAVQACIAALHSMGETLECAELSAKTLQGLLDDSSHAPLTKGPGAAPGGSPAGVDIEKLIQDPAIAEQLRRLGWAPPVRGASELGMPGTGGTSGVSSGAGSAGGAGSSHSQVPSAPSPLLASSHAVMLSLPAATTPGPRGQGIDFDWMTTPLSYYPLSPTKSTSALASAPPGPSAGAVPAPTPPHAGAATTPPDAHTQQQLNNLLQLSGSSIYDVLYAGASNQAFPSGNVWSWPFGFGGGASAGDRSGQ